MKKIYLLLISIFFSLLSVKAQDVFTDDYAPGVSFAAFGGSTNTISIDASVKHSGTASLKIPVTSGYTGGALVAATGQDLSAYNVLSFWAKNDNPAFLLDAAGIGNNSSTTVYACERNGISLTTTWTKYYIPIPVPSKLTSETGLFHFAEGSGEGAYTIWLDDIKFENVSNAILGTPTATFTTETQSKEVGQTFSVNGPRSTYPVNGADQGMQTAKAYFTWTSSNTSVATIDAMGTGTALATGTANITAILGTVAASGTLTVNVTPQANPTTPAPTPVRPAADVKSLFSNAYTNIAVETWSTSWSSSNHSFTELQIAGNDTKKYELYHFAGVEFLGAPVDATVYGFMHIDILCPAAGKSLQIRLVDFNAPNSEATVIKSTTQNTWVSYDIPLTEFSALTNKSKISQILFLVDPGQTGTFFIDNVYFYKGGSGGGGGAGLTVAAPTPPAKNAADVISIFSGAYADIAGTNFFPDWGQTTVVSDTTVAGNLTKKYANINYQGIQFASPIDASAMNTLHLDLWTADCTSFDVFLINEGVGEQKVTLTPTLSGWNSFDIALSQYTTVALNNIGQFKLEGRPAGSKVYLDNIYFYKSTAPVVSITSPAANASFTAPASIPITATATANNSGTISKIEFFIDGNKVGDDLTAPYSYTATNVLGGTHAITAVATDNTSQTAVSAAVTINVDGPGGDGYCGQSVNGDYQYRAETDAAGIVTFTMHPLAPIAGSQYAIINIKEGSGGFAGYGITAIGPDFTFSKAIADGTPIQFYFTYQVPAGGERNSSLNPQSYTVGANCTGLTGIPTISLTSPADNASYTEPASISFTTTAADNDGTVSKVEFYAGTVLIGTDNTAPFSFDWTNVPAGNYNIAAKVTDNANLSTYSKLLRVTVNINNAMGFCGTVANGDYAYRFETVGANTIFTFHPLAPIAGSNNAIIYINGTGTTMTPVGADFRYTQSFANGTPLSIYFTYNTPIEGGERNSSATPHSYTTGIPCNLVVVPVTLISFDAAKKTDGTVQVSWVTDNELNNQYFLIERSADGRYFSQLAKVNATNNAAGARYSISDRQVVSGYNYYRLTQVDMDGRKKVYYVKIVNISTKNGTINIYPNPVTTNQINIKIPGAVNSRLNVQLINMQGKIVYAGIAILQGDAAQLRLNNKPSPGLYQLKVGEQKSVKIIVN